jgi:hypothetical protein
MNIRIISSLVFTLPTFLSAQTPIHISLNQSRSLEVALNQVEKALGIPINYEDPRLACASELQDVTAQVQSAAQRAANPNAHIIVPKASAVSVDSILPSVPQPGDEVSLVTQLRTQYEANGQPGRFIAKQVGSVLTVEPSAARGPDCQWSTVTPAMETKISFPAQARDARETLSLILDAVTKLVGIKVGLANLPMVAFANRSVTSGAADEAANIVLVRLFEQLSSAGQSNYSYHLFYDPGLKYYLMDIAAIQPIRPKILLPAGAPPPPSGTALGGKPVKK